MYNLDKRLIFFNYLSYRNVLFHHIIILSDINYVKKVLTKRLNMLNGKISKSILILYCINIEGGGGGGGG